MTNDTPQIRSAHQDREEAWSAGRFALDVLQLLAEHEDYDSVWWRCDGDFAPITFLVNCNDLFHWACADSERVTPENLPRLRSAFADAKATGILGNQFYGPLLFCARERRMRPQKAFYENMPEEMIALFDACGEPRP